MSDYAKNQAASYADTISRLIRALDVDFERFQTQKSAADAGEATLDERAEYDILADILAHPNGDHLWESTEEVMDYIQEMPLSVLVRSDWQIPGSSLEASEYEILLSTGGPAGRITGDLDQATPMSARLEYQDWWTPWTEYLQPGIGSALVTFAQQLFFFGE